MRIVKFDFTEITDPIERADRINALGDLLNSTALVTSVRNEMITTTGWFSVYIHDKDYDLLKQQALWCNHYAGFDSLLFRDDKFRSVNVLSYPARAPRIVQSEPKSVIWIKGGADPIVHLAKGF